MTDILYNFSYKGGPAQKFIGEGVTKTVNFPEFINDVIQDAGDEAHEFYG